MILSTFWYFFFGLLLGPLPLPIQWEFAFTICSLRSWANWPRDSNRLRQVASRVVFEQQRSAMGCKLRVLWNLLPCKKMDLPAAVADCSHVFVWFLYVHPGWVLPSCLQCAVLKQFLVACVRAMSAKPSSLCSCRPGGEPTLPDLTQFQLSWSILIYLVKSVIQSNSVIQSF